MGPTSLGKELSPSKSEFLKQTLNSSDFEVISLAGDASSRRYYRVVLADQSWVLMDWEPFKDNSEYPFLSVLEHFAQHKILVPKVVAKCPEKGLILLEDLGDLTLERKFWESQEPMDSLPFYQQAIDELIKIHYPASRDLNSDCTAFGISFDTEKLLWEMNYGRKHLIETMCKINLSATEDKVLTDIFLDICARLDKEPKVICHRDYHSRNVMLKLGKMRVIDFQDARMGPIQYDLVSLVHDSYVKLDDKTTSAILDYYIKEANQFLEQPIARGYFDDVFRIQVIQRCFKACGSFSSFYNTREDTRYLKYLAPTLKKVALFLEEEPRYLDFLKVLNDHGILEKEFDPKCMP